MYGSGELDVQIYGKATVASPGRGQQTEARFPFPMICSLNQTLHPLAGASANLTSASHRPGREGLLETSDSHWKSQIV